MKEKKPTVSIIICTKDCGLYIEQCIKSALILKPLEIIVVDAHSHDNTIEIAKKYKCIVKQDDGTGLGNARNVGLKAAKGDYVLYLGVDNKIIDYKRYAAFDAKIDQLLGMINEMTVNKWAGIAIMNESINKTLKWWWRKKFRLGERKVIGTPFMFNRKLLNKYKFNPAARYCDDTELCERMGKDGYKFGYSVFSCFDVWMGWNKSVRDRFKMYGKGDRDYFLMNYKEWGLLRRIKSILHPLAEFKLINSFGDIVYIPFILYIVFWRYVGYASK